MDSEYVGWRKASYSNGSGNCVEVGQWRKASYSNGQGDCVEVGHDVDVIAVRDTKDHDGGALAFTTEAWAVFTTSLK
jgi:hypothetical protein